MASILFLKEFNKSELTFDDVITYGSIYKESYKYPQIGGSRYAFMAPSVDLSNYTYVGAESVNYSNPSPVKATAVLNGTWYHLILACKVDDFNQQCSVCEAIHSIYSNSEGKLVDVYEFTNTYIAKNGVKIKYAQGFDYDISDTDYDHPWGLVTTFTTREEALEALAHTENWEYSDDPYDPDGESKPGGGDGDFDDSSDPIDFPSLPTLSAVDIGFIRLYNPTLTQLQSLARYLWGNLFDISQWKKLFADPMDAIIGLSIVPVSVPNGGSTEITVGNIPTGIQANISNAQWVTVDCGYIDVKEHWGSYLDYSPYTKFQLYLPFIGIIDIDADDIMDSRVHIKYNVDILTGSCVAFVKCTQGSLERILYTFNGECAVNIPFTSNDWTSVITNLITLGATALSGVKGASLALGSQAINNDGEINPTQVINAGRANSQASASLVTGSKVNIKRSGTLSASHGLMARRKPYLIRTRPLQCKPKTQNVYTGYPSYIRVKLDDCSGFTIVDEMHLENVHATENELKELEIILKTGVYV